MRAAHLPRLLGSLALLTAATAVSHEGGLDANGCHYDRAHGSYHCHRDVTPNPDRNAPVKKSRENICHDKSSPNYRTVRYFISYRTMAACLASGGNESMKSGGGLSGH
ncbi:MAG TPA: YHYH domain-containing protein [Steroidobacteraceae bacterium]|nr:YHYH domain-containing protein [Steroidobacteraceae bacterium]